MMDEEIRQALSEVREMKQMCGNINMKLTNIVTQRGQDWKAKLEAEYHRGLEEGYERGLAEGKKAFDLLDAERDAEYQRGLDDAWEAARKIMKMPDPPYWGVFGEYKNDLFRKITAAEAIEKLKAYEEKQKADDKIEVGDEVKPSYSDITGVVTLIDDDTIYVLWRDGSSTSVIKLKRSPQDRQTLRHLINPQGDAVMNPDAILGIIIGILIGLTASPVIWWAVIRRLE